MTHGLDALGVVFALFAGGCWGAYILLNARVGRAFERGTGLTVAMCIAALVALPFGVVAGGGHLLEPRSLAIGAAVGVLSSAIPYSFEQEALRRIAPHVFGVLMSLEPGVAALAGLVILGQSLDARAVVGIALVVVGVGRGIPEGARGAGGGIAVITLRVAHTADLDRSELSAARALLEGAFEEDGHGPRLGARARRDARARVGRRRADRPCLRDPAAADPRRPGAPHRLRGGRRRPGGPTATGTRHGDDGGARAGDPPRLRAGRPGRHRGGEAALRGSRMAAWRGALSALTPTGIVPTGEEDGSIYVLAVGHPLDLDGELTCDWREGDVW